MSSNTTVREALIAFFSHAASRTPERIISPENLVYTAEVFLAAFQLASIEDLQKLGLGIVNQLPGSFDLYLAGQDQPLHIVTQDDAG